MTIDELEAVCNLATSQGLSIAPLVVPEGARMRIKGFPRGKLLSVEANGSRVYSFPVVKLRRFIKKQRDLDELAQAFLAYGRAFQNAVKL